MLGEKKKKQQQQQQTKTNKNKQTKDVSARTNDANKLIDWLNLFLLKL